MKFNTKILHTNTIDDDPAYHSVNVPIYQTTTYRLASPTQHPEFSYSRTSNPTRNALEEKLAALEDGKYCTAFSSGVAAIDAVLKLLKTNDEVIASKDLYGGTYRIFNSIYKNLGIKFHFVDFSTSNQIEKHINSKTKLLWLETPTNPLLKIFDIQAIAKIAKAHKIWLAVDNTFCSPYLQHPLSLGADVVMHSASKYLNGHSDVILGALVTNSENLANELKFIQNASGAIPGPMDCFLTLRGLKTLHVRMQRHCENAKQVAEFLQEHHQIDKVYWPGFKEHKNHDIAAKQMKDFGGVVTFTINNYSMEQTISVINKLKIFTLAESLGGVESLVGHPASMSHASIPKHEREKNGITDSLVRLSIGIEDSHDLLKDLEQALK